MLKVLMSIEHGRDHAIGVITRQRTALFAMLQLHRRRPIAGHSDPESITAHLVVDALIIRAEADLRWLDLCESRLNTTPDHHPIFSFQEERS